MATIVTAVSVGGAYSRLACRPRRPSSNLGCSTPLRNAHAIVVNIVSGDPSWYPSRIVIRRSIQVLASNPNRQVDGSDDGTSFKEDLSYLLKLGAGSLAGAAIIKYGSIIFPEITRPNILLALVIISTPVIVAVFLLIKQSREAE